MRRRIISLLVATVFAVGAVALPATAASAHSGKDGRVQVACVNPAGKLPKGQQPWCKGKAHHQIFKKVDDKRDHKFDKRDDHKRDHKNDKKRDDHKRDHKNDKRDHKKDYEEESRHVLVV